MSWRGTAERHGEHRRLVAARELLEARERVEAARALNLALTGELGRLKPAKGDAVNARLELERAITDGDRVLGDQQRDWRDAVAARDAAAASSAGRLAVALGLVSGAVSGP